MDLWLDGLSALTKHAWATFVVLLIIMWGFLITRGLLHKIPLLEFERLALCTCGWVIPVLFLSLFAFAVTLLFNVVVSGVATFLVILASSLMFIWQRINLRVLSLFFVLFNICVVLRFVFIADLVLPSYFDSAEHYRLIGLMTKAFTTGTLPDEIINSFYHLGFHAMISSISYFTRTDVISLMLVFGQIGLALLTFPLFFIVRRESGSFSAAVLTCLLFSLGFHMPAHLMNWGKYPALLGLVTMLFVLNLAFILYRSDLYPNRKIFFILMGAAVFVSTLIHSRTFILYVLFGVAAFITLGWQCLKTSHRSAAFFIPILFVVLLILAIQNNSAFRTLFDGYLRNDLWVLMLFLLLTFASMLRYALQTFFLITWLALCLLCLFIPIDLPVVGVQTLLDRPFVQMFLVVPFSLLGGLGLASLRQLSPHLFPGFQFTQYLVPIPIFGILFINIAANFGFYPSECCHFATRDDLAAFTWIDKNLSLDATILIASADLYVTSFESSRALFGVDAGIWITPLLSHHVAFAEPGIQFNDAGVHVKLCNQGIDFIYAGGMPQSFDPKSLESFSAWYSPSFLLPSAKIYQLTGCQK